MHHPLELFLFCPVCGAKAFTEKNEKAKKCTACGFIYYFNPSASVACFVKNPEGDLLLVRRAKDPAQGTLDLPGGFTDMHETAEETVLREVKEETGLVVTASRYLFSLPNIYLYKGFEVHTVDLFFECETNGFETAKAADDAAAIVIRRPEELQANDFGLRSIKKAVERYRSSC